MGLSKKDTLRQVYSIVKDIDLSGIHNAIINGDITISEIVESAKDAIVDNIKSIEGVHEDGTVCTVFDETFIKYISEKSEVISSTVFNLSTLRTFTKIRGCSFSVLELGQEIDDIVQLINLCVEDGVPYSEGQVIKKYVDEVEWRDICDYKPSEAIPLAMLKFIFDNFCESIQFI